jgi:hypothetical protein
VLRRGQDVIHDRPSVGGLMKARIAVGACLGFDR